MNKSNEQKAAFESIHDQYHAMVMQMCLGFMKGDYNLAKDLTQEVFINVWNALPEFKGGSSYKTWIYRITVNTCLLYIRDNKKRETDFLEEVPDTERMVLNERDREEHLALYNAIGELPQLERLIIMLVLEELEYDEIAKITGISPVNLRVKIHRIKRKMKQTLNTNLLHG